MILEITEDEGKILQEALECWEQKANNDGLLTGMLGAVFRPKGESMDSYKQELEISRRKCDEETRLRKLRAARIRAQCTLCGGDKQVWKEGYGGISYRAPCPKCHGRGYYFLPLGI